MRGLELGIKGCWEIELDYYNDSRGVFFESFKLNSLENIINRKFEVKQSNTSISKMGCITNFNFFRINSSLLLEKYSTSSFNSFDHYFGEKSFFTN